jgi:hypothetical protein
MANSNSEQQYITDMKGSADTTNFMWINRIKILKNRFIIPSSYLQRDGESLVLGIFKFQKHGLKKGTTLMLHINFISMLFNIMYHNNPLLNGLHDLEKPGNEILYNKFQIAQEFIISKLSEIEPLTSFEIVLPGKGEIYERFSEIFSEIFQKSTSDKSDKSDESYDISEIYEAANIIKINNKELMGNVNSIYEERKREEAVMEEYLRKKHEDEGDSAHILNSNGYLVLLNPLKEAKIVTLRQEKKNSKSVKRELARLLTPPKGEVPADPAADEKDELTQLVNEGSEGNKENEENEENKENKENEGNVRTVNNRPAAHRKSRSTPIVLRTLNRSERPSTKRGSVMEIGNSPTIQSKKRSKPLTPAEIERHKAFVDELEKLHQSIRHNTNTSSTSGGSRKKNIKKVNKLSKRK